MKRRDVAQFVAAYERCVEWYRRDGYQKPVPSSLDVLSDMRAHKIVVTRSRVLRLARAANKRLADLD